jgi:hypothetical protein
VYEAVTKQGQPVSWCGFDDQRNGRSLEVPTWMFEPGTCDHLRLADTPMVSCQALLELQVLLETAQRGDILQGQHRSLDATGGADATVRTPPRLSQPSLFHCSPLLSPPRFHTLPADIQDKTIRLLARLLRVHVGALRAGEAREVDHE